MLDLKFAELSDRGKVRTNNEDALGHVSPETSAQVQSRGWLFALADGVGGQDDGEIASKVAIETVTEGFRKIPKGVMHVSLLPRLLQEANAAVYDRGQAQATRRAAMATTLVACALRFDSAVVSHVGDSRCYLIRHGRLSCLTRDHTMADEQVRLGILSRLDADSGDGRHVLTRSLGADLFVAADTITVNILPGDRLLLCSDGLHGYIPDPAIQAVLNAYPDRNRAAAALIAAANDAGGHDNISVLLIDVLAVERMGLYRGRPYRLL